MQQLHPGAKWQFRVGGYFLFGIAGIFLGIWIIGPIVGIILKVLGFSTGSILGFGVVSVLTYIGLVLGISEIATQMRYNRWFYELTTDSIKLERGIIWKRYSNIPYERVQNVDITRGIIGRILGFSTVLVQTAGYSGPSGAEGTIPAVDVKTAEEIRAKIMKRVTSRRR